MRDEFLKEAQEKIEIVHDIKTKKRTIEAVMTTNTFGRRVKKKHEICKTEWEEIISRGWIE